MREQFFGFEQHIARGWGGEREVDHSVDMHTLHLKNHAVYRHTKNFWFAEFVKVVLEHCRGVEPITMPRASSSGTTCSLCGRSFRDPTDLEGLNAIIQVVASLQEWMRLGSRRIHSHCIPPLPSHSPLRNGYSGW